ncbi:MAG: AgmX/PglI C-terminal domain-containing protein [Polyangiales bacterium]
MKRFVLALVAFALVACDEPPPPAPTVASAEPVRGAFSLEREGHEEVVLGPTRVEHEAAAVTGEDGHGTLRLDAGGWVLLAPSTRAVVVLEELRLQSGRVWIDARDAEVKVRTDEGELRGVDATFAVSRDGDETRVYAASGEIAFVASGDRTDQSEGNVAQGETLVLASGRGRVEPAELWEDWTGGLAEPAPRREAVPGYVGILAGRGLEEKGVARRPMSLRAHEVSANVRGDFASTEVVQTFFNAESQTLEGEYRLRVPEGAIVHHFAVDLGGGFVDATIQPQAANGYQILWEQPYAPTSRLSWDGPGRLRARVHPVEPGSTVRVRVRYTEWLERRGTRRTYVYPMVTEGQTPPMAGELRLQVTIQGAVAATRAGMGATVDGSNVVVRRSDHRPSADFFLDLIDSEETDLGARAFVADAPPPVLGQIGPAAEGNERFVLFDLPTDGLASDDSDEEWEAPPLDVAVVVDLSGATESEDLELARTAVETLLRQLAPSDRVALRVGDLHARVLDGVGEALEPVGNERRDAILEALGRAPIGGATDLGAMLREAAALVADSPRGVVVYVGDGMPTTGALDATSLRAQLAALEDAPRFFAFALGEGGGSDLLRRLLGEDAVQSVKERTEASRAVLGFLAEAGRPMLRNLRVELGEGVERVFPRPPFAVADGSRVRLIGRLRDDLPTEVRLRAERDGHEVTVTLPLRQERIVDGTDGAQGDVRRRWASARMEELVDADAGREALVELGSRFGILTPWTSFVAIGGKVDGYWLIEGFDDDPHTRMVRFSPAVPTEEESGWRRRQPRAAADTGSVERTWVERVDASVSAEGTVGDGGLGAVAAQRVLAAGERGPRACYEQRLLIRPDLRGDVAVSVEVAGDGSVREASIDRSSLGEADVSACILSEVRGLRFPATGGANVRVSHVFTFETSERGLGVRRRCSDASRQSLDARRNLWRERLSASGGVRGALDVWRDASWQCELDGWRARRTLLDQMLRHVGGVPMQVQLYRALASNAAVASYLRRAILANVRTPQDVIVVRNGLGLEAAVDWSVFSRLWKRAGDAQAKLRLVRNWLEVLPNEMDLRLRLMALLEETGQLPEAKRVARAIVEDGFADAKARTLVGEMWLRQGDEAEARRVFSDIVEHAPGDPWARRRLGDLYRAHGWFDDAYREYGVLSRLRGDDEGVLLLLAHAAAGAGRVDEALRLEQRLGEALEPGKVEGVAGVARLWSTVRLAELRGVEGVDTEALARRARRTGLYREPPDVFVALTWAHPDDAPELWVKLPSTPEDVPFERAEVSAAPYGLEAQRVRDRDGAALRFEVRRTERDALRDLEATLTVIVAPGTDEERVHRMPITLTRTTTTAAFTLEGAELSPR